MGFPQSALAPFGNPARKEDAMVRPHYVATIAMPVLLLMTCLRPTSPAAEFTSPAQAHDAFEQS